MKRQLVVLFGVAVSVGLGLVLYLVFLSDTDATNAALETIVDTTYESQIERDPDVPVLPFEDNPDPAQCGIPVQWGESGQAWLSGEWKGEMIQEPVLVYDSHLRTSITGRAPHGTEVEIILFQENPVLDYYFVKIPGDPAQEGWVPSPFLSFEPVA